MNAMDAVVHHDPSQSTLSPVSSRRQTSRDNETPAQKQKREKAAERQRRKRERDRNVNSLNVAMSYPQPTEPPPPPPPQPQPPQPPPQAFTSHELSPEELTRRERVRASARERQRKHRNLVKQRKMRELGLDEMMAGIEEVQFRVNGQQEYPGLPPDMHAQPINPQDPSTYPVPMTGGQSFASMLMFSLGPMKPQVVRAFSLSPADLAGLESIIAEAFDQWDHQRRMHFAQVAKADGTMAGPSAPPFADMGDPAANGFGEQPPPPDEYGARFRRSIGVPPPSFRNLNPAESTTATTPTSSTPGSGPPSDPIDPHLGVVITTGDDRQKVTVDTDPEVIEVEQP